MRIDWHGHLEIDSLEWSDYWGELQSLPAELQEALDLLKNARDKYFSKGFNSKHAAEYCFRYFYLLSQLLQKNCQMLGGELNDIVLMCRLLNNISTFEIKSTDDEGFLWYVMGKRVSPQVLIDKSYQPEKCLTPQNYCPKYLGLSNGNTQISDYDFAYRVISLTDYYKGVECYYGRGIQVDHVYYPIRQFNERSLIGSGEESIIGKLIRIAKMVVIEDVDLTAACLKQHIEKFRLNCSASAINIDARYSSRILAIANKDYENYLPGQRIC